MEQPGLATRHRDKHGEISRKHGNTLVRTLRKTYGMGFALGWADDEKLRDVFRWLDELSRSELRRDHQAGTLEAVCRE